eukprot:CAMPEP_0194219936 /NCGR_PEP_ID=MMETSP0156-20130528/27210_1 /TAXON_ID=33649 /ORGANISM="Thalassionema nitzschioides, Strain L26-B" /LENGTH=751 /DNA_ID=CAMNT_0038949787 /DNA_START=100 /DNA_END=2355 /DNA_ORIENTATION=-
MNNNHDNDDVEEQQPQLGTIDYIPGNLIIQPNTNNSPNTRKSASAPTTPVTLTPSSSSVSLNTLFTELPNDVSTEEQLLRLPSDLRSDIDPSRPLQHIIPMTTNTSFDDDDDNVITNTYALRPMWFSVQYILLVELLERFCFYGINYTQTAYLTGVYDDDWNADLTAVEASSLVAICIALAYTSPFVGATLADATPLGEYGTILLGCAGCYLPGLLLLWYTTIPQEDGNYPTAALLIAILCLWPMGTGMVKSVVNVFGAKQFHPIVQSACIESYYVNFYMCINIGALLGGILIPIVAQFQITVAYSIPVFVLSVGVGLFLLGTNKYVRTKKVSGGPNIWQQLFPKKTKKKSRNGIPSVVIPINSSSNDLSIASVAKVCLLLVPFNIAYSQMCTTFIIQGTVMRKFGVLDAASMNNADTLSVLFFGYWIGNRLYPFLAKQGIKLPTTHKFALGSFMGVCALSWALWVEYSIHTNYSRDGTTISVLWQIPSYTLIGIGEIFAVSSAYEVAFTIAPPPLKGLASAVNLFFIGGLPNVVCLFLYQNCSSWFENAQGRANIHTVETYTEAHVYYYFTVLWSIAVVGVVMNLLPNVVSWVQRLEDSAAESIKTPSMTPNIRDRRRQRQMYDKKTSGTSSSDEQSPLLVQSKKAARTKQQQQHADYLDYGSGPLLHKSGSMRAGPTLLSSTTDTTRHEQQVYSKVQLYQSRKKKKEKQLFAALGRRILPPIQQQQQQQQQQANNKNATTTIKSKEAPY